MSDQKLDALAATPLFASCNKKQLKLIGSVTDRVDLPAGHVLVRHGTIPSEMYMLITGSATVEVDGKEVATIGAGEVVAELSMVDGGQASATVTMTEAGEAWVIRRSGFIPVWEQNPDISTALLLAVVARLKARNELIL
ncbi:MAG: cyclic nucleotide-binding domain-containing protein [Actinomycetota bacterium]